MGASAPRKWSDPPVTLAGSTGGPLQEGLHHAEAYCQPSDASYHSIPTQAAGEKDAARGASRTRGRIGEAAPDESDTEVGVVPRRGHGGLRRA